VGGCEGVGLEVIRFRYIGICASGCEIGWENFYFKGVRGDGVWR
jgi:hypothetical protein